MVLLAFRSMRTRFLISLAGSFAFFAIGAGVFAQTATSISSLITMDNLKQLTPAEGAFVKAVVAAESGSSKDSKALTDRTKELLKQDPDHQIKSPPNVGTVPNRPGTEKLIVPVVPRPRPQPAPPSPPRKLISDTDASQLMDVVDHASSDSRTAVEKFLAIKLGPQANHPSFAVLGVHDVSGQNVKSAIAAAIK